MGILVQGNAYRDTKESSGGYDIATAAAATASKSGVYDNQIA